LQGNTKNSEKILIQRHLFRYEFHFSHLEFSPGLRGEKAASSCLSYGTTYLSLHFVEYSPCRKMCQTEVVGLDLNEVRILYNRLYQYSLRQVPFFRVTEFIKFDLSLM
jgi:hypothetical protein